MREALLKASILLELKFVIFRKEISHETMYLSLHDVLEKVKVMKFMSRLIYNFTIYNSIINIFSFLIYQTKGKISFLEL